MTNHEKFLGLYNDLDNSLRKKYHNTDRTVSMITKFVSDLNHTGSSNYMVIAKKINMIRIIRNNLIHELDMNKDNLIEITDETITFLEGVIKLLEHPRRARDLSKTIDSAYTIKSYANMKVVDLMKKMREKGFSQVPIIDDNLYLKGIFSPNVLFEYISQNPDTCVDQINIRDVLPLTIPSKHFSETYLFVKEDMDEEALDDMFMDQVNQNKKPAMIFVTKNGTQNEKLQGIIVLKDLIDDSLLSLTK